MRLQRYAIHTLALLALPIVVAAFGIGVPGAIGLVLVLLAWRWALVLGGLTARPTGPDLRLETIGASHFVEKVRWCLDVLGAEYRETQNVGVLGAFFAGRTVPRLHVRTGSVTSVIGDSPHILRYLWGCHAAEYGERAAFLEPTREATALEAELDAYGVLQQQWIYHHILDDRALTLHAWGADDASLPLWQRLAARGLFPLLRILMRRAFRLSPERHGTIVERIEDVLGKMEARLGDGREHLLGGSEASFVDYTLAALSGLWAMPERFGGGRAEATRPAPESLPPAMREEMDGWRQRYPRVLAHIERHYASRPDSRSSP